MMNGNWCLPLGGASLSLSLQPGLVNCANKNEKMDVDFIFLLFLINI